MTVPSPLDRGFVSIVSLLSSSPTDRRVKYRCVPNPDNSVSIQRWPKHEIPTLLTFSGFFFEGGGELFLDTETIFKVDFFVSYQKIVIIYTTCKLSNFWLWKKWGFFCNTTIYSKIHAGLYFVCWSLINLFHTNLSLKHSYVQSSNLYYFCFVHFFLGFIITDLFSHIWGLDFLQEKFVIFTFCYEIMLVLQLLY